jgi:hypothetical protein
VVKKRTAGRAPSRKVVKKKAVKKAGAVRGTVVVRPGAAIYGETGVDLKPLKKAIRLSIERLTRLKETPKVAGAIESLVAVQQRLTADCTPTMEFPNS